MDERTLRERLADSPRPAVLWIAGVLVLILLELGRVTSGIVNLGDAAADALDFGAEGATEGAATGGSEAIAIWIGLAILVFFVGLAISTWTRMPAPTIRRSAS